MTNGANGNMITNLDEVKDRLARGEAVDGVDLELAKGQLFSDLSDDPKPKRSFALRSGVVLELRPINPVVVRRIEKNTHGKPQVPIVETEIGPKKTKQREANPNDPEYQAALKHWEEDHNEQMLIYGFSHGIASEPSEEELEQLKVYLPGESKDILKYTWVMELIGGDDDDIQRLFYAILGQTLPTEQGIRDADQRFPGDRERSADTELSASES